MRIIIISFLSLLSAGVFAQDEKELPVADTNYTTSFESLKGKLPFPVDEYLTFEFADEATCLLCSPIIALIIKSQKTSLVKAVANGKVVAVLGNEDWKGVIIQHGEYYSTYFRVANPAVSKGMRVLSGQKIGEMASNFDGFYRLEVSLHDSNRPALKPSQWFANPPAITKQTKKF